MATEARNTKYRVVQDVLTFAAATGTVFNEGDLVYLITGTGLISVITGTTTIAQMLGDVQGTQPTTHTTGNGCLTNTYNVYVGRHTCKLIARDVGAFISNFTPVYYSTDAQSFKVASGSETTPIGVIAVNPKENGNVPSGTTVIGTEYEVLLRNSYALSII